MCNRYLVCVFYLISISNFGNAQNSTISDEDSIQPTNTTDDLTNKIFEEMELQKSNYPTFIGADNSTSSGPVLLKGNKIYISNFRYDGLSPDAFFVIGTGSNFSDNINITNEFNSSEALRQYTGENIVLTIPEGLEIDWLAVYCYLSEEAFGHVFFNPPDIRRRTSIKVLPRLTNTLFGVESSKITVVTENVLEISKLYFDLDPTNTFFWVGIGVPDENGVRLNGSLRKYLRETVTLELPVNTTFYDYDYLAIWNAEEKISYGHVVLHTQIPPTFYTLPAIEDKYGMHSGPILIVDDKTFFVTNFHFDGVIKDARFAAGSKNTGYFIAKVFLEDEYVGEGFLGKSRGVDLYLSLPDHLNVYDIGYFGVYRVDEDVPMGYTTLPDVLPPLPQATGSPDFDSSGNYIARLPKCCPLGQRREISSCVRSTKPSQPIKVFLGNMSMFDDEFIQNAVIEYYEYAPKCPHGMFSLNSYMDEYYLLTGGILFLNNGDTFDKDQFCTDTAIIEYDDDEERAELLVDTAYVCFSEAKPPEFLNDIIATCIFISSFFLTCTALIFLTLKDVRVGRGVNVIGYTLAMALSFLCLAIARVSHIAGKACYTLGFIYQYFLVSSFIWLFCLTYDSFYQVTHHQQRHKRRRYVIFSLVAILSPILAVILSYFVNSNVIKPTNSALFGYEPCWFRSEKKVIFYFTPIGVSIILSILVCIVTWIKIKARDKESSYTWNVVKADLKNVYRSCYLLLVVMTICWSAEIISYFFETRNAVWLGIDIIESLQGLFVFLIFIMHKPVSETLHRKFCVKSEPDDYEVVRRDDDGPKIDRAPTLHLKEFETMARFESVEDLAEF